MREPQGHEKGTLPDKNTPNMERGNTILVQTFARNEEFAVRRKDGQPISDVKEQLQALTGLPTSTMRVIHDGHNLSDTTKVSDVHRKLYLAIIPRVCSHHLPRCPCAESCLH